MIRVFRDRRKLALGSKDIFSHTMRMYESRCLDLSVAGPHHGEMSELIKYALRGSRNVTLVAAGSVSTT